MKSKNSLRALAAVAASAVILCSSCASSRNKKLENEIKSQDDSIEQPKPLAPPVIIPHSWREEMNKQK